MLHICTWWWGHKYGKEYPHRLSAGLARNLAQPYRFHVVTDRTVFDCPIWDPDLTEVPGCFARLRMFKPGWQERNGIADGDRVVCMDLDAVITGPLDALFDTDADFSILQGINTTNPCPYNGSLWMFRAGYRPDVWNDFSLEAASRVPFHAFPDDQGWLHHKLPGAASWGPAEGVYGFKKKGWPSGDGLPKGARFVAFPGWRDPSKFEHLDWIKKNWTA